ncbi:transcriptional regulator [Aureimonas sp. SA4125]|nr:transcriptional regulator [Aureimonas sp. SA4125]
MNKISDAESIGEDAIPFDIDFLLGQSGSASTDKHVFRIGDLAREFAVTLRTLRFYEDRGLLNPERRGTTRLYSRRDRVRLRLILLAKTLGFSLTEAKQMIEIYHEPNGKRRQLEVALKRFEEQQQVLLDQKRELDASIEAMGVSIEFVRDRLNSTGA